MEANSNINQNITQKTVISFKNFKIKVKHKTNPSHYIELLSYCNIEQNINMKLKA